MATFGKTDQEVVRVVDCRGIPRAPQLDATRDHAHDQGRVQCLPAHCGPHLHPLEGFWRVMQDTIGAGRWCGALQEFYPRTRRVLLAHQERPMYACHW